MFARYPLLSINLLLPNIFLGSRIPISYTSAAEDSRLPLPLHSIFKDSTLAIALFDLDNTLLADDSDYLWGCFLAEKGIVDSKSYEAKNQYFYDQYKAGTLDIFEFLAFQLRPLADHSRSQLETWRKEFLQQKIEPLLLPKAQELVHWHQSQGHLCIVITATNRFITEPISQLYGIENLIATEPEQDSQGEYTGRVVGTPCFQGGKIVRLQEWMRPRNLSLEQSWFYSDSHNDLPLLRQVSYPHAVDPDDKLRAEAQALGWPVMSLR